MANSDRRDVSRGDEDGRRQPEKQPTKQPAKSERGAKQLSTEEKKPGQKPQKEKRTVEPVSWSVDPRGDLPTEEAVKRSEVRVRNEVNESCHVAAAAAGVEPSWPAEADEIAAELAAAIKPVEAVSAVMHESKQRSSPSRQNHPHSTRCADRETAPPVASSKKTSGRGGRRNVEINIPGIDLSMLPHATTRISFRTDSSTSTVSSSARKSHGKEESAGHGNDETEKVSRGLENLSWNDDPKVPVGQGQASVARRDRDGSDDEEPASNAAPIVATSNTADGSNSNPTAAGPTTAGPAAASPSKSRPKNKKKNVPPTPNEDTAVQETEAVSVPTVVEPRAQAVQTEAQIPAQAPDQPIAAQRCMSPPIMPFYGGTANVGNGGHPMMMMMPMQAPFMPNPADGMVHPQAQIPAGFMVPVWVTCPFCYNCFVYPPVPAGPLSPSAAMQQ